MAEFASTSQGSPLPPDILNMSPDSITRQSLSQGDTVNNTLSDATSSMRRKLNNSKAASDYRGSRSETRAPSVENDRRNSESGLSELKTEGIQSMKTSTVPIQGHGRHTSDVSPPTVEHRHRHPQNFSSNTAPVSEKLHKKPSSGWFENDHNKPFSSRARMSTTLKNRSRLNPQSNSNQKSTTPFRKDIAQKKQTNAPEPLNVVGSLSKETLVSSRSQDYRTVNDESCKPSQTDFKHAPSSTSENGPAYPSIEATLTSINDSQYVNDTRCPRTLAISAQESNLGQNDSLSVEDHHGAHLLKRKHSAVPEEEQCAETREFTKKSLLRGSFFKRLEYDIKYRKQHLEQLTSKMYPSVTKKKGEQDVLRYAERLYQEGVSALLRKLEEKNKKLSMRETNAFYLHECHRHMDSFASTSGLSSGEAPVRASPLRRQYQQTRMSRTLKDLIEDSQRKGEELRKLTEKEKRLKNKTFAHAKTSPPEKNIASKHQKVKNASIPGIQHIKRDPKRLYDLSVIQKRLEHQQKLQASLQREREENDLKECTFHPVINARSCFNGYAHFRSEPVYVAGVQEFIRRDAMARQLAREKREREERVFSAFVQPTPVI